MGKILDFEYYEKDKLNTRVHDFNWIRFDDEDLSWEDILEFRASL